MQKQVRFFYVTALSKFRKVFPAQIIFDTLATKQKAHCGVKLNQEIYVQYACTSEHIAGMYVSWGNNSSIT